MGETIKTDVKYKSYFWVKWEVQEQDTASNKSTIAWSCGLSPGEQYYTNAIRMSAVTIGGVEVYAGGTYSDITDYKDRTFGSGTLEVEHDGDGSKTLVVGAFSGWLYGNGDYNASSRSFALPTIPRATTPGIGGVTIGETAHISLPRASGGFTHTLRYVFGGAAETIASGVATGYDWLVPESLAAQIPNAASGKGTLTCETYSGSTYIGTKSVTFTASVPGSMKPTVLSGWAAVSYDNSGTAAENMAAWVQGYSKAKATFDASKVTCRQGAGVSKFSITYLGKTTAGNPCRTETISTTGATVRCTVTDSRGLTAWEDFNIALLEYAPPALVGADLFRSDGEGAAADGGTHIAGVARARYSELGGLNSVTLKGYWKSVGGGYGAGETLTVGAVGLVTGDVEISADRSYIALLVLTDSLGNSARYEENIPTEKVAFHLKEGGKGAAFGKAAETEGLLELAEDWHLKLTGATDLNAAAEKIAVLDPGGVVRYRTKAELLGDLAADYIVEQGISGIWTYRKWAGGILEYWGKEQGFTLEDGWHGSPAAPHAVVNAENSTVTVTNWYGTDDNRAARPNIITCGGLYEDGSVSVYDRNPDGTPGTGYRAYYYHVNARWK